MKTPFGVFYLTREAKQQGDTELVKIWRQRSIATGSWMGILALTGVAFMATAAPELWTGFQERAWPLVLVSVITGFFSLWALWRYHFNLAVLGVATTVTAVILGWGIAQYPAIIPPAVTIDASKGPDAVLWAAIAAIAVGSLLLLPSLGFLFYLFKSDSSQRDAHSRSQTID